MRRRNTRSCLVGTFRYGIFLFRQIKQFAAVGKNLMMELEDRILKLKVELFKQELRQNKPVKIKVWGSSMWPFLKPGDTVIVTPVDIEKVSVGDIVLTYLSNRTICHRVFRKKGRTLQTKPDALPGTDSFIREDAFLGRITAKVVDGETLNMDGYLFRCTGFIISKLSLVIVPACTVSRWACRALLWIKRCL